MGKKNTETRRSEGRTEGRTTAGGLQPAPSDAETMTPERKQRKTEEKKDKQKQLTTVYAPRTNKETAEQRE
jgi:hypothetical protein